jgi:hypothetical protein
LAPQPQARAQWTVAGQTRQRQTTLADLSVLYQHFLASKTEREPHATVEVKAAGSTTQSEVI